MSAPAPTQQGGTPGLCWNCRQSIPAGSDRCIWCGVPQRGVAAAPGLVPPAGVPPVPVAPGSGAVGSGSPGLGSPGQQPPAPLPPSHAAAGAPGRPMGAPAAPMPVTRASVRRTDPTLPEGFRGTPAGVGARLGSFTIDVLVIAVVAVGAGLLGRHWVFALLGAIEVAIGLWVLQARTGLTVGNALLRLRTARADVPFSPGVGRGAVRLLIVGVGSLVAIVGAWVVVASSGFDRSGLGRSWADRAARTIVVRAPKRETAVVPAVEPVGAGVAIAPGTLASQPLLPPTSAAPTSAASPAAQPLQPAPGLGIAPSTPAPAAAPVPAAEPGQPTGWGQQAPPAPAPAAARPSPAAAPPSSAQPSVQPPSAVSPSGAQSEAAAGEGTLLLVFDTGQREQLPTPVAVNLGRQPAASEPSDRLIVVGDPESTVSKTHLRLEHSRGRTWVTDTGSTNGTDLLEEDGDVVRLPAGVRTELVDGTRVRIGNRAFTVSLVLGGQRTA